MEFSSCPGLGIFRRDFSWEPGAIRCTRNVEAGLGVRSPDQGQDFVQAEITNAVCSLGAGHVVGPINGTTRTAQGLYPDQE